MCRASEAAAMQAEVPVSRKVAVIGAGAAGLVAARELQREGHAVQVYENSSSLGGVWNYQEEVEEDLLGRDPLRRIIHGSLYSSLRTNLPREIMSYSDFPFIPEAMHGRSTDARRFPHHTEVLAYMEAFADHFNLRPLVRFSTHVVRLDHAQHGRLQEDRHCCSGSASNEHKKDNVRAKWTVVSRPADSAEKGTADTAEEFDAVVVAIGNYHEPNLPDIAGMDDFPGRQLHCHNFRHNEPFRDERVLVVGASYSGIELAGQVADAAGQVYHSARTWSEAEISKRMRPNLERMPMLTQLHADGSASFSDGRSVDKIDSVIYCTGYKYKYRLLEHLNLIRTEDQHVHPLYRHVFVPSAAPTLAFIGLLWKSLRNLQFETQAKWVAQVLSGRAKLPDEATMIKEMEAFYDLRASHGVPKRYMHCQSSGMPVTQWEYNNLLRLDCNPLGPPAEEWRRELHDRSAGMILKEPDTFRDHARPEIQQLFDRARAGCLGVWHDISNASSHNINHDLPTDTAAKANWHSDCLSH
ncbi:g4330 [Coccomyxa viridis]|uniref:Flavin-containing monooxygenase n=1 Tax=Coccomyxa viridis TaxID=1274662 RepID=A0ABP1FVB8_9CHLO